MVKLDDIQFDLENLKHSWDCRFAASQRAIAATAKSDNRTGAYPTAGCGCDDKCPYFSSFSRLTEK
jgi:hypothetical protein